MSRSRKKTPVVKVGTSSAGACKKWKKAYNKQMRRVKDEEHPKKNEFANPWIGPSDGKMYVGNKQGDWVAKALRK